MKQLANQATNQQRQSRKGGDTGIKERILSRILTVCCTKGMTLMIEIRDYEGGDYGMGTKRRRYAAACVFSKTGDLQTQPI